MRRKKAFTQPGVQRTQVRKLAVFAACLVAAFCLLGYRLVDLQILRHEELSEQARNNTERTFVREPKRGEIRDARGNLLATSKRVYNLGADPDVLGPHYSTVARRIAPLLGMTSAELEEKIRPRQRTNDSGQVVPVRWVPVKKKVETEEWERVRKGLEELSFGLDETKLNRTERAALARIRRRGIFAEPDEARFYPNESLAAHVLGYVGVSEQTAATGKVVSTIRGKDGLELTLDSVLAGVHGWRQTETDSAQREVVLFREQDVAPRAGLNVVLTLDAGVQHIVEDELKEAALKHDPVSVTCVVVRPKTGEILAMAALPAFDPNRPGEATAQERRNRIISDLAEPGSTFKIVVVAGGINEGLFDLDDSIDCENGRFLFAGRYLHDDHPFSVLTVERVISKSSNIGAAKIGIQLGRERLYRYVRAFGFGQRTGIPLPGEVNGLAHPVSRWSGLSISRIPMGHEIACTPLQMTLAMCAIANQGLLMRPMLVDRFVDEEGRTVAKFQPQVVRRVISPETAAKMVTALKAAVSTNGTGLKAKLPFHTVAGKTGTAQKIVDGRYTRNKHYSSFIGFFPADNPELCVSVMLDEPKKGYYGGETAAPLFQRIAERAANYLAIPPEHLPDQTLAARAEP